jgi:hypothetical protein
LENLGDVGQADRVYLQAHAKEFTATGNLRKSSVDSLERIVARIKRKQAGLPAPKPTN